jgi:RNA polymerase sigma-70 factor, ECF subfamily
MTDPVAAVAASVGRDRLSILAGLIRRLGDWELAQDCLQDAVERALEHWPVDGVPDNPAAWLTTVAHRRAIDLRRRRGAELQRLARVAADPSTAPGDLPVDDMAYPDDQLALLLTCCHPALPPVGRVALTLRTVGGLSTRQIARAFLVSEDTMTRRLTRAREKIAHTGIRLQVPPPHRIGQRLAGARAVLYLVFNQGYSEHGEEMADEAIRLTRLLDRLVPDDDETRSLLALLVQQHSRRAARVVDGVAVPLPDQDRSRWDAALVAEAQELLAVPGAGRGQYRIQAEIAVASSSLPAPDWDAVVGLYDELAALGPSPVVALNRCVALSFRDGPEAALPLLDSMGLDPARYPLLEAVRADLLRRSGRPAQAAAAYRRALVGTASEPEKRYLAARLADC